MVYFRREETQKKEALNLTSNYPKKKQGGSTYCAFNKRFVSIYLINIKDGSQTQKLFVLDVQTFQFNMGMGYENIEIVELIHLKIVKHVLNLKSCTPSYTVYGETGRFPLSVNIYSRVALYLAKFFFGQENKIVHILYKYLLKLYKIEIFKKPWIDSIFDNCGFFIFGMNIEL